MFQDRSCSHHRRSFLYISPIQLHHRSPSPSPRHTSIQGYWLGRRKDASRTRSCSIHWRSTTLRQRQCRSSPHILTSCKSRLLQPELQRWRKPRIFWRAAAGSGIAATRGCIRPWWRAGLLGTTRPTAGSETGGRHSQVALDVEDQVSCSQDTVIWFSDERKRGSIGVGQAWLNDNSKHRLASRTASL